MEYTTTNFIWVELKEFPIVFDKIKELFPDETMDLYFTPKTSTTHAGGELFNAYRYAHYELQKTTGIGKNKKQKKRNQYNKLRLNLTQHQKKSWKFYAWILLDETNRMNKFFKSGNKLAPTDTTTFSL